MKGQRSFRSSTTFVVENFEDVKLLRQALDDVASDLRDLLQDVCNDAADQPWFGDGWETQLERGGGGLWVSDPKWPKPKASPYFGIAHFSIDAAVGELEIAQSYLIVPSWLGSEAATRELVSAAGGPSPTHGPWRSTERYPLWRYLDLSGARADRRKLGELLLDELSILAAVVPALEALMAKVGQKT